MLITVIPAAALQAADILEPAERTAITSLIDAVVKAGFPDARAMTLYHGDLNILARSGPMGEEPRLPCDASHMQETTDSGIAYHFTFPGLHAKTASGSWLIAFAYDYMPRATDEVTVTGLTALDPVTLTATAQAERAFDAATQAKEWLALLGSKDRPRLIAAMDRLVPVSFQLKIKADNWPAAALLLSRAGWPDADLFALAIADQRARSYWQLRPWSEPDSAFDPTGAYPRAKQDEQAWQDANKVLALDQPATAWRRALFRFCKNQLSRDEPWLQADIAAACCRACLDPLDPQGNAARITALRAARDLPVTLPADASLVTRLQSWEGSPRQSRMTVSKGNAGKAGDSGSVGMTTTFSAPVSAYKPMAADMDDLVTLLSDPRPSRWNDFSGARSVGDNAWRALAVLLKQDPRSLAKISTDAKWTVAERATAARAFQTWWKINGAAYRKAAAESASP